LASTTPFPSKQTSTFTGKEREWDRGANNCISFPLTLCPSGKGNQRTKTAKRTKSVEQYNITAINARQDLSTSVGFFSFSLSLSLYLKVSTRSSPTLLFVIYSLSWSATGFDWNMIFFFPLIFFPNLASQRLYCSFWVLLLGPYFFEP
jgi:hypothetical protein